MDESLSGACPGPCRAEALTWQGIIPSLNKHTLARMTSGERRVAQTLAAVLEDDYLVWYDIPVAKRRRYPDFIILHPSRGLLFLEIKDWKPETLKRLNKTPVRIVLLNRVL